MISFLACRVAKTLRTKAWPNDPVPPVIKTVASDQLIIFVYAPSPSSLRLLRLQPFRFARLLAARRSTAISFQVIIKPCLTLTHAFQECLRLARRQAATNR